MTWPCPDISRALILTLFPLDKSLPRVTFTPFPGSTPRRGGYFDGSKTRPDPSRGKLNRTSGRRKAAFLATAFILLVVVAGLFCRRKLDRAQAAQQGSISCCGAEPTSAPRELDFPYYSLREGFSSTLNLVSDSPHAIDLTIAIHSRAGQTVLTRTSIQPQQKLALDLRQTLAGLGADTTETFAEGNISVYFEGTIMPVAGQVTISNAALKLVHESEMVENDPGRSDIPPVLNALWWNLGDGRDASIMVSNMSGDAATADVYLDFGGKRRTAAPLVFTAHETKVISVLKLLGDLGSSASQAPEGGITIVARGTNPSLIAQGRVLDPATGFSTTLEFPDPARQKSSALHAVGLPIGTPPKGSPYAGTGNFTPHVVVRNLLPDPQIVTLTVEYPTGKYQVQGPGAEAEKRGKREFDGEAGEATATPALGPFTVAGYSTQDISLDAALGQLPLPLPYCSVRIQYSGAAGTLIAQVLSVDAKQDLVVDAPVENEGDGWAGSGANPWHLGDQTESILFLTDESDKPARIGFRVTAGGVPFYLINLKLRPHETRAIDLRKLRDAQIADFKGHKIPADATDGGVNWIRLDNVPVSGRMVVINRKHGLASSYHCSQCPCPANMSLSGLSVDPTSFTVLAGGSEQVSATAIYVDCNTTYYYEDETYQAAWSSSNPSVASVAGGLVSGISGGSAGIQASYTDCVYVYECQCNPITPVATATATVQPKVTGISPSRGLIGAATSVTISGNGFGSGPTVNAGTGISPALNSVTNTSISVTFHVDSNAPSGNHSVTVTAGGQTSGSVNFYVQVPSTFNALSVTSTDLGCEPGTAGVGAKVQYQVLDQANSAINVAGLTPQEHFTVNGTPAFPGFRPFATPQDTDATGKFLDIPIGTCFGPPIPPSNVCVDVVQTFNVMVGSVASPISTTTTRRDCVQGIRVAVSPGSTTTIGTVN
jgi:IPT/TIG domain